MSDAATYCHATWSNINWMGADSADPDSLPDRRPLNATVTFTPIVPRAFIAFTDPAPTGETVFLESFATQIVDGVLYDPAGGVGVWLLSSATGTQQGWTWRITVTPTNGSATTFDIHLDASMPSVDLRTQLPLASSRGVTITKGDPGESAYNLAVADGFAGTEAEWLASLHGTDGAPGAASMARTTATNLDTLTGAANAGAWSFGPTAIGHPTGVGNGVVVVAAAGTHTSETATLQSGEALVRYYAGASWSTWQRLAAVQDTGWRDVTSLFDPAAIAPDNTGTVHFRRIGNVITCKFVSLKLADGTGDMNLWDNSIPTGWRPSLRVNSFISRSNSIPSWNAISAWTASITWYSQWTISTGASTRTRSGLALIGEMSWRSADAFPLPAAYPGTPTP